MHVEVAGRTQHSGRRKFHRGRAGLPALLVVCSFFAVGSGAAWAATPGVTSTESRTESLVFNPATTLNNTVTVSSTEIVGRLAGGAPLYDQTFGAQFSSPVVQAGVQAARLAITNAGGPGVVIGGPTLTASSSNTVLNSVTTYSLAATQPATTVFVDDAIGPATTTIGNRSICSVSSLPSSTRPTCVAAGTPFVIAPASINTNFDTRRTYAIDQSTVNTQTTTNFEQYTLTGTVQQIGMAHAAAPSAAFDQTDRFNRRLLDAASDDRGAVAMRMGAGPFAYAPSRITKAPPLPPAELMRWHVFAEGWGTYGRRGGSATAPGDTSTAFGVTGGVAYDITPDLRFGVAIDHGRSKVDVDNAGESVTAILTQVGVYGAWRNGGWFARASGSYGGGDVDSTIAPTGLGIIDTANYSLRTASANGEIGRRFGDANFGLTPLAGAGWLHVETGSFTEAGSVFALTSNGGSWDRGKFWLGGTVDRSFDLGRSRLTLTGYGRAVGLTGDRQIDVAVAFAGTTTALAVQGLGSGAVGADFGGSAVLALTANTQAYLAYDARWRDDVTWHTGSAGVRVNF